MKNPTDKDGLLKPYLKLLEDGPHALAPIKFNYVRRLLKTRLKLPPWVRK